MPTKTQPIPLNFDEGSLAQRTFNAHDGQDGDVYEYEGGYILNSIGLVKGPKGERARLKELRWQRLHVVLAIVLALHRQSNRLLLRELVGSLSNVLFSALYS